MYPVKILDYDVQYTLCITLKKCYVLVEFMYQRKMKMYAHLEKYVYEFLRKTPWRGRVRKDGVVTVGFALRGSVFSETPTKQ